MDDRLRQLEREAKESGDYAAYERALSQAGQTRLVFRRLWLKLFFLSGTDRKTVNSSLTYSEWSATNIFTIHDRDYNADIATLVPGVTLAAERRRARVLHVECKEIIVPTSFLEEPEKGWQEVEAKTTIEVAPEHLPYAHISIQEENTLTQEAQQPYVQIECDRNYFGGDYNDTGDFVYIPWHPLMTEGDLYNAFTQQTGMEPLNIIHLN